MAKNFWILLCCCISLWMNAQSNLDSLLAIEQFENDSLRAATYTEIGDAYFRQVYDLEQFNVYASKALIAAKDYGSTSQIIDAYIFAGKAQGYLKQLDSAMNNLDKAVLMSLDCGDSNRLAQAYLMKSIAYNRNYNDEQSVAYLLKVVDINEKLNDNKSLVISYYNLGVAINRQEDYEKALSYFLQAYRICENEDVQPRRVGAVLNQIARSYGNIYEDTEVEAWLDSTYKYANIGLNYAKEHQLLNDEIKALDVLFGYYQSKNDFSKALDVVDECLQKARGNKKQLCVANRRKADLLLAKGKPKQAIQFALKSLEIAKEMDWESHIMFAQKSLYDCYKSAGDYVNATEALEAYHELNTEITNKDVKTAINELEQKYQTEKKESKIRELEQNRVLVEQEKELQRMRIKRQNWLILSLIVFAAVASLLIWLFQKQQQLKKDRKILQTKHKLLRSQMNPHFLFNGFAAVQRSIMTDETKVKSITHLSEFSRLMRAVLDSSFSEFVSLENELNLLNNYLSLQRFRFEDKFFYSIDVDQAINCAQTLIPPMLLQPFLENSIEHGRVSEQDILHLALRFSLVADKLKIEIEDDGVGLTQKSEQQKNHISRATSIVQERLKLLDPIWKGATKLEVINLQSIDENKSGVKVEIELPFHQNSDTF